ncbi:MAG TPA: Fic family protein, partial [Polyangiaceae bacterium]|nr:Fic family protein [Polyangiaceae bacterium]
ADVEPARGAFASLSREAVERVVRPKVPDQPGRTKNTVVENDIDAALRDAFGDWAAGWRWARDEGSIGGGPVVGWCCPQHSVWRQGDKSAEATVGRAAAGLLSWRDWIIELAARFGRVDPNSPPPVALERHAFATLEAVIERTGAGDAWYAHAAQVLSWMLESLGAGDSAPSIVKRAIGGRFESWSTPPLDVQHDVARALRDAAMAGRGPRVDGLELWWAERARADWSLPAEWAPRASKADAVLEHVVRHDAAIDEGRGDRMLAALERARASARRGEALTWEGLAGWQAEVLGGPAALRAHDAWAKGGRERYGRPHDLEARVRRALAEASAGEPSPAVRGARLYLDLCFLHPFADGNARAARLGLDFVLTRAGLAIDDAAGALFRMPLPVDEPGLGERYLALLARHVVRVG